MAVENTVTTTTDKWNNADSSIFSKLWSDGVPYLVIAALMDRSASALQTRASRLGMPPHQIPAFATRNRLRWTDGDYAALEEVAGPAALPPRLRHISDMAMRISRTIDTVINKIGETYGVHRLALVVDDYRVGNFKKAEIRQGPPGAPPNTNKRCIVPGCRVWFWAENRKTDWKCKKCRDSHEGMADTDIDFWCY